MSDEVRKKSQYHEKLKQRNSQDRAPVYRERNHRTPRHPRRTELLLKEFWFLIFEFWIVRYAH